MPEPLDALISDLVAWVAAEPRPYKEVMEAWRTSCPRLTVWEDAVDRGYVVTERGAHGSTMVAATPRGRDFLAHRES